MTIPSTPAAPNVKYRIADAVVPAQIARRDPGNMLLQHVDDLLFREPALTHRPSRHRSTEP
jgi:hypothetical protein